MSVACMASKKNYTTKSVVFFVQCHITQIPYQAQLTKRNISNLYK